jgi:peptidyl-tRNA hydrolase
VDFVLGKFSAEEREAIDEAIVRAVEGTLQYCTLGAGFAMNYTNT